MARNQQDEQQQSHEDSAAVQDSQQNVERASEHAEGLEHSRGGITTRHDATDLGVPMLPGDPNEPQGPEDALGIGPKRGDYSERVGPAGYHPHEVVQTKDGIRAQAQRPRASEQGEEAGRKGGVNTEGRG